MDYVIRHIDLVVELWLIVLRALQNCGCNYIRYILLLKLVGCEPRIWLLDIDTLEISGKWNFLPFRPGLIGTA